MVRAGYLIRQSLAAVAIGVFTVSPAAALFSDVEAAEFEGRFNKQAEATSQPTRLIHVKCDSSDNFSCHYTFGTIGLLVLGKVDTLDGVFVICAKGCVGEQYAEAILS